ncbi:alpha-L RNA-binding motif-containing protein [Daedalea quercina L-15889]|uniref:Alpha-L RNA-binding motif-containing protein n=1 Tax=Daedalea quercina L-15889 TaxID=1314783 RepID=A0A165RUR1_9APHY|nr:alpha-L RNA-binding motif-containing protein [Daedalea quercina L-15889]
MRDANVYHIARAMPRMSWHPRNLYNLWCRSLGAKSAALNFKSSRTTLFKQRWLAKALLRAYHGDYIKETIFKRWYLPQTLPDVRRQSVAASAAAVSLNKWAQREDAAAREVKRLEEEREKGLAPVVSLIFAEVERRIDVLIFRSCFAQSVYEARRLVIHGQVMLNGKRHTNANTRLAPGDMFSVNPEAIRFLQRKAAPQEEDEKISEKDEAAEEAYAESESESEEAHSEDAAEPTTKASESESASAPDRDYRTAGLDKWKAGKGDTNLTPFHLPPYASPFIFIPAYIEASFATCSAIYLRHPTARPGYSEIPTPYDADGELMRMAWEWYSKRRSRIRSKSQWAREPENRR